MPVKVTGTARAVGMIPLKLNDDGTLCEYLAGEWLREEARHYTTVLRFGLECENTKDRESYGMLAVDFGCVLAACGEAIKGDVIAIRCDELEDPRERMELCRHLARICATRPLDEGAFQSVYDDLARRIAELLAEPREAA